MLGRYSDYEQFVREQGRSFDITGWGGHVLKQKFIMIKSKLKECHQQHAQNIDERLRLVKDRMSTLDSKGEMSDLVEAEVVELHDLSERLHSLSRVQSSMCWRKARLNWLHEGDANTKKIHALSVKT